MGNILRARNHIIQGYEVQMWAGAPKDSVYRQVLSPYTLLPYAFTVETYDSVGAIFDKKHVFAIFAANLANLVRPTSYELEEVWAEPPLLQVQEGKEDDTLLRRISGTGGNPTGLGIYERRFSRQHWLSEALFLFGLVPTGDHTFNGHLTAEIYEIMSGKPHDMQVTYEGKFAFVEARDRDKISFNLRTDQPLYRE